MSTPEFCSVSHTRSCEKTSMARDRGVTPRHSSGHSSPASTAKHSSPECERSLSRIASSILAIAPCGKCWRTCQRPARRCFIHRLSLRIYQSPEAPPPPKPPPPPEKPPPPPPPPE